MRGGIDPHGRFPDAPCGELGSTRPDGTSMTAGVDEAGRTRFGMRDLAGLIRIYEANYVRLAKLVPDPAACDRAMISRVAGALDLHLVIIERQPHTTSLVLTYRFTGHGGCVFEPNARINVYHDVRAAEVVSHCRRRRSRTTRPWTPGRMPEFDHKWRMNRFLLKWLRFCTFQGHIFIPGITPTLEGRSPAETPLLRDTPLYSAASSFGVDPSLRDGPTLP